MRKCLQLILLLIVMLGSGGAMAQERTITGKVTAKEDGQGIPGVNVVVQGTTRGTTTDVDGSFKLSLEASDDVLSFSFVGYKTQIVTIGAQTDFNIVLESEATSLQEVVVMGYGVQKKSDVTGATANIKGEELSKQPVLTATQAMQGKIAGVQIISSGQPGSSPQFRLRGLSTALAGTTALFVVDGVLTDDISNINTADIVDMNILKDASSAAIYGSRGANGVIIITTRKGKSGKIKINYSNNIGFRQAANLVPMANSAEYRNYVQAATGLPPPFSPANIYGNNTNWYKTILRNALEQSHNISFSGGSDKSTFLLNVGYLDDHGIILANEFKRLTVRLNSDYQLADNVKLGIQASYASNSNQNGFGNIDIDPYGNVGSVYNDAYRASPIIASQVRGKYGNSSSYQNVGNPLLDVKDNDMKALENRLQGSSFLEVKPVRWITLKTNIGADWKNQLNRLYNYAFDSDTTTFQIPGGTQRNARSNLTVKNTQTFRWVWDNTATINKSIGKHDFILLIGTTAEKYHLTKFSASRKDVPADQSLWYINVGDANSSQNDGGGDEWTRNSYLARLNYSYDGKYLLTGTLRRDGSSRLPGKNRWQTFPSVGLAWVITNEKFMKDQTYFDFLKVRASYGKVGNDQIPTDAFSQTVTLNTPYNFNGSAQAATSGAQINQVKDPNITWEITKEYDVALEFTLLQSRLLGEINYYNKEVQNALINKPVLATYGYDLDHQILTNAADIQNKGIEVSLNWKDNLTEHLSYSVGGNITLNKNNVVALNGGLPIYGGGIGAQQGFVTYTDVGHPVGSFYALKVIGVFNTDAEAVSYTGNPNAVAGQFKYADANHDNKIDFNTDKVFAGSYQPKAYYGINLGLNLKMENGGSFDFSTNIYGNAGNQVYNGKKAVRVAGKDNIERSMAYNRWSSINHTQTEPAANAGNLPASTYYVESGSFVRLNNITIGYTFPMSKYINNLRVYLTSQNLFTYKKYSGFTAELPGDPINSGIELSTYPTTRTFALGVNMTF